MGINIFDITGTDPHHPEAVAAGEDFDEYARFITTLYSARKQQHITQKQVARVMGTKQSVISDIERVGGNPTIRTLQRYARAVGLRMVVRAATPRVGSGWTNAGSFTPTSSTVSSHTTPTIDARATNQFSRAS